MIMYCAKALIMAILQKDARNTVSNRSVQLYYGP